MTTYSGWTNSKSVNARNAEVAGRFPASVWVHKLRQMRLFRGVTAADIRTAVSTDEWHHVGKYAAECFYYGLDDIFRDRIKLRATIAARRSQPRVIAQRYENCCAEWLDWGGTRKHPRAYEKRADGIAVTIKGELATLHLPSGDLRKRRGTRGFTLYLPNGERWV